MAPALLTRHLLLALAVIVAIAYVFGAAAQRLRQPRVLGEMVAGVVVGPSLLGAFLPGAAKVVFPVELLPYLKPLSDLGIVLFMFGVGMAADFGKASGHGRRAVAISHASIIVPLGLGSGLGALLHRHLGGHTDPLAFSLFIGAAMSVTAFPVLARILKETDLDQTRIGVLTLSCAAVDDVTAWCVLAGVLAVAKGEGVTAMATTAGEAVGFALVVWLVVRPLLARRSHVPVAVALLFAFGCAAASDAIGVHAIFGAFLAGAAMPRRPADRLFGLDQIEAITETLLLPVFFVLVGLSTRVGLIDSWWAWGITIVVLVVAVVGKLGGASVVARACGESWRDATTIGVLMNTRGLTELVILSVGLERRIIPPEMFSMMVLMAFATTLMAVPLLRVVAEPETAAVARAAREDRRRGAGRVRGS